MSIQQKLYYQNTITQTKDFFQSLTCRTEIAPFLPQPDVVTSSRSGSRSWAYSSERKAGSPAAMLPQGAMFQMVSHTWYRAGTGVNAKTFFFFLFCIPSYMSGAHHFGWDLSVCDCTFNPNIQVVTLCLHEWCMLDVYCFQHSPV